MIVDKCDKLKGMSLTFVELVLVCLKSIGCCFLCDVSWFHTTFRFAPLKNSPKRSSHMQAHHDDPGRTLVMFQSYLTLSWENFLPFLSYGNNLKWPCQCYNCSTFIAGHWVRSTIVTPGDISHPLLGWQNRKTSIFGIPDQLFKAA